MTLFKQILQIEIGYFVWDENCEIVMCLYYTLVSFFFFFLEYWQVAGSKVKNLRILTSNNSGSQRPLS